MKRIKLLIPQNEPCRLSKYDMRKAGLTNIQSNAKKLFEVSFYFYYNYFLNL